MALEPPELRYVPISVDLASIDDIVAILIILLIASAIPIFSDAATKMWNSHLVAVRRRQEESVLDLQAEATAALDATVDHLCR